MPCSKRSGKDATASHAPTLPDAPLLHGAISSKPPTSGAARLFAFMKANRMQPTVPGWRNRLEAALAAHAHLPQACFVQVATVRLDGRPANRTLTFRFFLDDDRLLFTADRRTEKMAQLAANPWTEACWYFPESRVQFRLLGKLRQENADNDALRLAQARTWRERTGLSRQSFGWPASGAPRAPAGAFETREPAEPPDSFCMLALDPEQVDVLDLAQQPHDRRIHYLKNGAWSEARINP